MNFEKKLAIVIPAYKIAFFKQSLESIANQTCKKFTLYIGDDASPSDFNEILTYYKDSIDIVYKRFEENIGKDDLVAHWNRCIDLTRDEEWIWLFSDDDIMDSNCVELFYNYIKNNKEDTLIHFNIDVVNENNIKIFKTKRFQSHYTTIQYFDKIISQKIYSCAVEYIFKKQLLKKVNGIESFDLAWSSDTATWMKLSLNTGISTIEGAVVKWRFSHLNISGMSNDKAIVLRKLNASISYLKWAKLFFKQNNITDFTSELKKFHWLLSGITYTNSLNFSEKYTLIIDSLNSLNIKKIKIQALLLWLIEESKKNIKHVISNNLY